MSHVRSIAGLPVVLRVYAYSHRKPHDYEHTYREGDNKVMVVAMTNFNLIGGFPLK